MGAELWEFVALVTLFVVVLVASYWFMLLPDYWTRKIDEIRQNEEG